MSTDSRVATIGPHQEVYRYLEARPHSWRRELYLKGRNMTVGQLVYDMRANNITPEEAVANYDLPLEQVLEALLYYQRHRELVEADVDEERRDGESRGIVIGPRPLSR
jgi:uncharacterized protein (DUF433 family)